MNTTRWVAFELSVTPVDGSIRIRIADFGERFAASVEIGSRTWQGLGASAREALVAALSPLGSGATTAVLAAPAMFAASAGVLAAPAT